jgi:hypothetical protein
LASALQAGGALLEVQLQQRRQAHAARVVQRLGEVDRLGVGGRHRAAVDGAAQGLGGRLADPAAGDVALQQGWCHGAVGLGPEAGSGTGRVIHRPIGR